MSEVVRASGLSLDLPQVDLLNFRVEYVSKGSEIGHRSVGIPGEKGTTFTDEIEPTNKNDSYHFKFFFRIP